MAGEEPTSGLTTAVAEAMKGDEGPAPRMAQLPLPMVGDLTEANPDQVEGRRGPGRPPGARNKRTEEWVAYLLSRYPSPLVALMETYSRPTEELARELMCRRIEAFDVQRKAAADALPYLHQKLPLAVQVDGKGALLLQIMAPEGVGAAGGEAAAFTFEGRVVEPDDETGNDGKSST